MWLNFQIKYFSYKLENSWEWLPKKIKYPLIGILMLFQIVWRTIKYTYYTVKSIYKSLSDILDIFDEKIERRLKKNRRFVDVCRYLRWQVTAFGHIMWHNSKWADRFYKLEKYTFSKYRSIFFKKQFYQIFTIILLVLLFLFLKLLNPTKITWFITSIIVIMPLFLLWQTFIFFFKTYQISKFTNANQNFWKRALFLFWAIEGFLFSIALFIWFISPTNLKIGIGHNLLTHNQFSLKPQLLESIWIPVFLIIISRIFLLYKKNSKNLTTIYFLTILPIITKLVWQELHQLISIYTKTRSIEGTYSLEKKIQFLKEIPTIVDYSREDLVINQTTMFVSFLKFWHVTFILVYLVFFIIKFTENKNLSLAVQSSLLYNFNYLLVFNTSYLLYYYRKLLYFVLEIPSTFYYISVEKKNFLIFIESIYNLFL